MAAWSTFYPDLLPHVPGVAEPMADQELRRAAQEFFRFTKAWRQWLGNITLTGAASYTVALPTDALVHRFDRATVNGQPVALPGWSGFDADPESVPGQGQGFTTRDRITVVPVSAYSSGVLKLRAVLVPADQAATLPDELVAQFRDAIVAGAKARLMLQPGKGYSSPALGGVARSDFVDAMGTAQHQALKDFGADVPRPRIRDC